MRRILAVVLASMLLFGLVGCAQKAETSAADTAAWQEQYDLGVRYLSEGKYEEAIIAFTAAIEIDPKRPEAYVGRGDAYAAAGDSDHARADYEKAGELGGDADVLAARLEQLGTAPQQQEQTGTETGDDAVRGTLSLSNLTYRYDPNSSVVKYNEGAIAGLEFDFTVNGPANVKIVRIATWSSGFTQEQIDEEVAFIAEIWKEKGGLSAADGNTPPFEEHGVSRPVDPEEAGQTQEVLLIGLDENMNAAGYAVITVTIPG